MPSLFRHLLSWQALVWASALALLATGLCQLPLFNTLGYEFSLALAPAVSLAAAQLGNLVVSSTRRADAGLLAATHTPRETILLLVGRAVLLGWSLLALPLALISLNALRVPSCNWGEGFATFIALPLCSATIAASCGVLWGLGLPRPALASAATLLTVGASLVWGVYRFYSEPPVSAYDPFVGYFAGSLYDEQVSVGATLLWSRAYQLCWLGSALALAVLLLDPGQLRLRYRGLRDRPAALVAALLTLSAALLTAERASLGFAVDRAQITHELGGRRFTRHFELIYPSEWSAERVAQLVEDHELRYAQLAASFDQTPPRIRSFIFRDAAEKKRLLGTGGVLIAKPWLHEIYLEAAPFPLPALKHELAHVFAAAYGDPLFGVSLAWVRGALGLPHPHLSVGLIEGLAVAVDWHPYDDMSGDQRAAALLKLDLAPPMAQLFGLGFLGQAGGRSYAFAGAFCRYLMERYGMAKLLHLYRTAGDFARVYGKALPTLANEWQGVLRRTPVPAAQLQLATEIFRRPSIFRRPCPHEVTDLQRRAGRLQRAGKTREALAVLRVVCRHEPDDPAHLIALMEATARAAGPRQALAVGDQLLKHPKLSGPLRRHVLERLGDLAWLSGDAQTAARRYDLANGCAATPGQRRVLSLKRLALRRSGELRGAIMRYLVLPPGRSRNAALDVHLAHRLEHLWPASGVGPFLLGKQLISQELWGDAIAPLRRALGRTLPDHDFVKEARRALARCLYEVGDLEAARTVFSDIADDPDASAGDKLSAADWLARIRWRGGTSGL